MPSWVPPHFWRDGSFTFGRAVHNLPPSCNRAPLAFPAKSWRASFSGAPKTEIGKSPAETRAAEPLIRTENLEIAGQRLGRVPLSRGNAGGSHTPGNHAAETGLAGCLGRIRTALRRFRTDVLASHYANKSREADELRAERRVKSRGDHCMISRAGNEP